VGWYVRTAPPVRSRRSAGCRRAPGGVPAARGPSDGVFRHSIAYILYPLREFLTDRGLGTRLAAAASTITAFLIGVLLFAPLVGVLYFRRRQMFDFLRTFPDWPA